MSSLTASTSTTTMASSLADNVTGASAAMPHVPLPPPKPALDHLPSELIGNVVKHIPGSHVQELLALRRTCRFYRSVAADFLVPDMSPKLRRIRVLMTKDGLTALLELMSVPNWRSCIQCVEFIDAGVDAIAKEQHGEQDRYRWLNYYFASPPFETIQNKVAPAQRLFWIEDAPSLLKEIFNAFKTIQGLDEIHFGAKGRVYKAVLGLEHFIKDVGFTHAGTLLAQEDARRRVDEGEISTRIPAEYTRLLHQVLSDTGFEKRIIHLNVRNLAGTGGWSLPGVWACLGHPSLRKLNVLDTDHMPRPESTMTHATMRLDTKVQELTLVTTNSMEKLQFTGCSSAYSCAVDTETFSLLATTKFPNLTQVELIGYAVTSEELIAFFRRVHRTVRDVFFTGIHLTSGSWATVLAEMREFDRLRAVKTKNISEMMKRDDGSFERLKWLSDGDGETCLGLGVKVQDCAGAQHIWSTWIPSS